MDIQSLLTQGNRQFKTAESKLGAVERIAALMDDEFQIPGTRFRFGLDPIIGMLPLLGDISTFLISAALVVIIAQHGASRKVILLMTGNILIDAIVGAIPILGRVFDFAFKANRRNITLLRRHYEEGKYQGSGTGMIVMIVLVSAGVVFLASYGTWKLMQFFMGFHFSF